MTRSQECRNCGSKLQPSNRFCVYCGEPVGLKPGIPDSSGDESVPEIQAPSRAKAADASHKESASAHDQVGQTASGDENLHTTLHSLTERFKVLPIIWKVAILGPGVIGSLIVLSPIAFLAGAVLIAVSVIAAIFRLAYRRPWKQWGIIGIIAILPTLAIGGVSDALYDTRLLSFVGADYKSGDSSEIGNVEKEYLRATDTIFDATVKRVNEQIDLYNSCNTYCSQSDRALLNQNAQSIDDLLARTRTFEPPEGYEESHDAFLSGMEIASSLAFSIAEETIDVPEVERMIEEEDSYFSQSVYLMPASGRSYHDLHLKYE